MKTYPNVLVNSYIYDEEFTCDEAMKRSYPQISLLNGLAIRANIRDRPSYVKSVPGSLTIIMYYVLLIDSRLVPIMLLKLPIMLWSNAP